MSKEAAEVHFAELMGKIIGKCGPFVGKSLVATHIDSWENGRRIGHPKFREEFKSRRGYDPMPLLPVMTGHIIGSREKSERFLWDVRQTVNELVLQNYAGQFRRMANRHGLRLSIEAYTSCPCDELAYGEQADEPMGEFWSWWFGTNKKYGFTFSCTQAASAAHIQGRKVVAPKRSPPATARNGWGIRATSKTLATLPCAKGSIASCSIATPCSPGCKSSRVWQWARGDCITNARRRGGACPRRGTSISRAANISCGKDCSWPTSVISVRKPRRNRSWAKNGSWPKRHIRWIHRIPTTRDRIDYSFDLCSTDALLNRMSVKDGRLTLPDGMSYRLLVLPNVETMTPKLLAKVKDLVEAGVTIVGSRPSKSPSLSDFPKCDSEVQRLPARFGEGQGARATDCAASRQGDRVSGRLRFRRNQGRSYRQGTARVGPMDLVSGRQTVRLGPSGKTLFPQNIYRRWRSKIGTVIDDRR